VSTQGKKATSSKSTTESNGSELDQIMGSLQNTNVSLDDLFNMSQTTNTSGINKKETPSIQKNNDTFDFDELNAQSKKPSNNLTETVTGGSLLDDLFGGFPSNNSSKTQIRNPDNTTVKKTTLSGAIKESKSTNKAAPNPPKTNATATATASNNDAWELGGSLINLNNLSGATTAYAPFNPDPTKKKMTS